MSRWARNAVFCRKLQGLGVFGSWHSPDRESESVRSVSKQLVLRRFAAKKTGVARYAPTSAWRATGLPIATVWPHEAFSAYRSINLPGISLSLDQSIARSICRSINLSIYRSIPSLASGFVYRGASCSR